MKLFALVKIKLQQLLFFRLCIQIYGKILHTLGENVISSLLAPISTQNFQGLCKTVTNEKSQKCRSSPCANFKLLTKSARGVTPTALVDQGVISIAEIPCIGVFWSWCFLAIFHLTPVSSYLGKPFPSEINRKICCSAIYDSKNYFNLLDLIYYLNCKPVISSDISGLISL